MRRIDRKGLRAPACVLDIELTVDRVEEDKLAVDQYQTMWCLSRAGGVPVEISFWDIAEDTSVSIWALRDQLRTGITIDDQMNPEPSPAAIADLDTTVVICTRDRPVGLRATLASLQRQTDPNFGILVLDNGSSSPESAMVVEDLAIPRSEFLVEPRPGLSRARNRALEAVRTELVAFIDDDEIADPDWMRRLKEGFNHEVRPEAVCGVMLPAELEFEAQVRFEQYGGFSKGRGVAPEVLRKGTPSVISPLYPLPSFGSGGNMAFRTESLRSLGGFDPRLGLGTRTLGGGEVRALSALLSSGRVILHWPAAITWHTHRREMAALRKQLYGYTAGLSAFYASTIRSRPSAAFDLLRLAPYVLRDLGRGNRNLRSGQLPNDFPPYLLKAARRGFLDGGFMYVYETLSPRSKPISVTAQDASGASNT
jgi:glycosyltransferase involved in cell wall biosynthesis